MRRTILLGSMTPIVAMAVLALTETVLLAQAPKAESPKAPAAPLRIQPIPEVKPVPDARPASIDPGPQSRSFVVIPPVIDASPIRRRFLELSKKKALALTEEQLKHEVERMEGEVRELEAWAKAQEAVRLLQDVIEKHPNTKAAETANAAIQLIEQQRSVTPFSPEKLFERASRPQRRPDEPTFGDRSSS